jgi:hypothetical protein
LDNVPAFLASHGIGILCSDALNLGAVSGFTVAGITGHHAVFIQEM